MKLGDVILFIVNDQPQKQTGGGLERCCTIGKEGSSGLCEKGIMCSQAERVQSAVLREPIYSCLAFHSRREQMDAVWIETVFATLSVLGRYLLGLGLKGARGIL